jgi:thiopurine S-methyltransferase
LEPEFWHQRWAANQTGFHEGEVNHYLRRFLSTLALPAAARVFVPLCGKAVDLDWLAAQGLEVFGIELSPIAVEAFFAEHGIEAQPAPLPGLAGHAGGGIHIACGDFFTLRPDHLSGIRTVYDRAALIALPSDMRRRYVRHLQALFPQGTRILLVTLDYPQAEMDGPPFAVPEREVRELYAGCEVRLLASEEVLPAHERFASRGLTHLTEAAYLITLGKAASA